MQKNADIAKSRGFIVYSVFFCMSVFARLTPFFMHIKHIMSSHYQPQIITLFGSFPQKRDICNTIVIDTAFCATGKIAPMACI